MLSAIKQLKRNKSHGIAYLLNEYFIACSDSLSPYLCKLFNAVLGSGCFPDVWSEGIFIPLFNAVLDSGCFPDVWSEGIVIPLFKKGDKRM